MRRAGELLRAGGDGPITAVIATEGRKADGVDLKMSGARLDRYRRNPVIGYGHAYGTREDLPIGRAERVRVEGRRLLADLVFDQADEFAQRVERKLRDKVLSAFSIGFSIDRMGRDGVAEQWTLTEVSVVPVPMDEDALVLGRTHRGRRPVDRHGARQVLDALTLPERYEDRVARVTREVLADYLVGRL